MINVWLNNARVTDCLRSLFAARFSRRRRRRGFTYFFSNRLRLRRRPSEKQNNFFIFIISRKVQQNIYRDFKNRAEMEEATANLRRYSVHHAGMMSTTFDIVVLLVCISASLSLAPRAACPLPPPRTSNIYDGPRMEKSIKPFRLSLSLFSPWRIFYDEKLSRCCFSDCLSIIFYLSSRLTIARSPSGPK